MKIVIIRHAEPDYPNNTLTERGFKEAEALGKYYNKEDFDEIYVSTLNRALYTAEAITKDKTSFNRCDWLVEFGHPILVNGKEKISWDTLPSYFDTNDHLRSENYLECDEMKYGNIKEKYDAVIKEFDAVLEKNGYKRDSKYPYYDVTDENKKTILFVCHFGMMSVLMSRLMNIPYTVIAQHMNCYPSGVTTFVSEEREQGIAQFRMLEYSNVEHLRKEGMEPSFAGRWAETFYTSKERH